ncbi:MAG: hypothetical protein MK289_17045 [Trichodesmium sp. ALOHA_ZT_67]|nr:hypothetical protein [Trichodesmium sp. ALOHA_ZT_67]
MEEIDRNSTEIILINGHQDGMEVIINVLAKRQNLKIPKYYPTGLKGCCIGVIVSWIMAICRIILSI